MSDEQLLKNITKIIDKQFAKQLEPIEQKQEEIVAQINLSDSRLQYIEVTHRGLLRQFEGLEKTYKSLDQKQQDILLDLKYIEVEQQAQGENLKYLRSKTNKINKIVDYIAKRFDERIVQNMRDIALIKHHIGLPSKN
ncbi:MAG: hypothetical protein ACREHC_04900 [Candidatus Levyibacteriota bacterium]